MAYKWKWKGKTWPFKWKSSCGISPNLQTTDILPRKKIFLPKNAISSKMSFVETDTNLLPSSCTKELIHAQKIYKSVRFFRCVGVMRRCRSPLYWACTAVEQQKHAILNSDTHLDQVLLYVLVVKEQKIGGNNRGWMVLIKG